MTNKQITDLLCPLIKEESEQALSEITWGSNQQGYGMFNYLAIADLDAMWAKTSSSDIQNIAFHRTQLNSSTNSCIMNYTKGYIEYTLLNSCNHTIEVLVNTFKPKYRHSKTLYECWDLDLLNDDTLGNAVTPLNVEKTKQDYGVPIIQPARPASSSYVKSKYSLIKSKRVVLAVGETFTYKIFHKQFRYDVGRENMYMQGTTPHLFSPEMYSTSIICRSQLVVDSTGSQVAHGSGKVAIAEKIVHFTRPTIHQKAYQTYAHGGLDTINNSDQFHYNVDTEGEVQYTTS